MSSGERAKPPTSSAERNPFDVSRRSQTEVASEIAKRMAAWKQARGRSYATGTASAESPSKEETTRPLGAPVQPARMPQPAERAAQPADQRPAEAASAGREARAPFFATFSLQRAMPPAPSPKAPASESQAATVADENDGSGPGTTVQAQETPSAIADLERPAEAEPPAHALPPESPDLSTQPEAAPASPNIEPAESAKDVDDVDVRRARARDVKARWMQAHDFEEPPAAESPHVDQGTAAAAAATQRSEEQIDRPIEAAPHLASAIPPIETLDEISGRREPTLDTPASGARAIAGTTPESPPAADGRAASEPPEIASAVPPTETLAIETLDEIAGRKEPVFDQPLNETRIPPAAAAPPVNAPPAQGAAAPRRKPAQATTPAESLDRESSRRVARLDRALSRRAAEAASRAAPAAEPSGAKRAVDLPAMQTRIEARRIDTLRADPHMAAHRPIFPHIEPEAWEVASVIDRPARRERRGTGWAIGLGAALLIIGITAPAAILRQGLEVAPDDQDVATGPLPPEEAVVQPEGQDPVQSAAQATPPATSRPQASTPAEPAEAGPEPRATSQAASSPMKSPDAGAESPQEQTTLGAVRDGGVLQEAPIAAPPPPWKSAQVPMVNLASQDKSRPSGAPYRPSPMVARPFVPDRMPKPFLPAPDSASRPVPAAIVDTAPRTVGGATVELDAPAADSHGASIGLRPALIPQLKPKAPAVRSSGAAAPKKIARKPRPFAPQSLEQMFEDLVDSLSEGEPPNPALKPVPPSTRK